MSRLPTVWNVCKTAALSGHSRKKKRIHLETYTQHILFIKLFLQYAMNENLKVLKKILFILQKSSYVLEYKRVSRDYLKATSRRRQRSWPSSLYDSPNPFTLGLSTPESSGTIHWGLCSLNMTKVFGLNKAENHKTKNKFATRRKKCALLSRFYFKTFIQASLWFQAPQPKGIKWYWSLMAWKVAFWIKAHPVTKGGGEGICN